MVSYEQYIRVAGKDPDRACDCELNADITELSRWLDQKICAGQRDNVTAMIIRDKVDALLTSLYDYSGECLDCASPTEQDDERD